MFSFRRDLLDWPNSLFPSSTLVLALTRVPRYVRRQGGQVVFIQPVVPGHPVTRAPGTTVNQ